MCWFYRVRHSCGGQVWGERQRQCARSIKTEETATGPPCSTKLPARLLHDPSECLLCSGEILPGGTDGEEDGSLTWATVHQPLTLYWTLSWPQIVTPTGMRRPGASNYINPSCYPDQIGAYQQPQAPFHGRDEQPHPPDGDIVIQHRCSCLFDPGRREPNSQPTAQQAYRHLAGIFCIQCNFLKCPRFDCTLKLGHEGPHGMLNKFRWCNLLDCTRELGHPGRHRMARQPPRDSWDYSLSIDHLGTMDSRALTARLSLLAREGRRQLEQLNRKVLEAMTGSACPQPAPQTAPRAALRSPPRPRTRTATTSSASRSRRVTSPLSLHVDRSEFATGLPGSWGKEWPGARTRTDAVSRDCRGSPAHSSRIELSEGTRHVCKHPSQKSAGVRANSKQQHNFESGGDDILSRQIDALSLYDPPRLTTAPPYDRLDQPSNQIRLFKLEPCRTGNGITGSFLYTCIVDCPYYTALSYTWGDLENSDTIRVERHDNSGVDLGVAENLLCFLRIQSRMITEAKLFWIDAICINQTDIHERNHQVGLMKLIYTNADSVYVWLGPEADDSNLAMRYLSRGGPQPLRSRGPGFYPVWTHREARALGELCERPYWRRMWIIQEVIHADNIRVWCGDQSADWAAFGNLYHTLKTLDDMSWSTHHRYAVAVLQSSALTMVWQRAHWRHPETPVPTLQTLVEVFQEWKCSDLRDKVYALVGLAAAETAVAPDYSLSARQ